MASLYLSDIFFRLGSGNHDLMSTALTFQPKIRSNSQNLPLPASTGMLLFHGDNIIQDDIGGKKFQLFYNDGTDDTVKMEPPQIGYKGHPSLSEWSSSYWMAKLLANRLILVLVLSLVYNIHILC